MIPPELNPSELDALRLKRDIDHMVKRDCYREDEFVNFPKQKARKTKPKRYESKTKTQADQDNG